MNRFFSSRLAAISRKEFLHIIRDPRTLIIIILMPVLLLVMFGYAFNMELQLVELAVVDHDRSPQSQNLIEAFDASDFFVVSYHDEPLSEIEMLFLTGKARAILMIPADFSRSLRRNPITSIQVLIDAADPNAATAIQNYCNQVISNYNRQYNGRLPLPFTIEPSTLFNPNLISAYFFVPGILALLLIMISAMLTSITVTREKELGTMEQILVSPVRPFEIIIGKVLPYIVLAFLDGVFILVLGMFLFNLPFIGSAVLLAGLTLLFIITALALGLMLSTVAPSQQVAMMGALMATLLPTLLLSGFIFPIQSMPVALQYFSYIVPAKYYLVIARGILLKGNTLLQLLPQIGFLSIMTLLLLGIAWKKFSTTLE